MEKRECYQTFSKLIASSVLHLTTLAHYPLVTQIHRRSCVD